MELIEFIFQKKNSRLGYCTELVNITREKNKFSSLFETTSVQVIHLRKTKAKLWTEYKKVNPVGVCKTVFYNVLSSKMFKNPTPKKAVCAGV